MFSIIIPSLNNLEYLKLCIASIKKNSEFDHEIIVHVNIGSDGTLSFLKKEKIKFTYSKDNSGICEGVNRASKLSTKNYILYAHDDFYFCPGWDTSFNDEINSIGHNKFYLSGTMIQNGQVFLDCGNSINSFNEEKLLKEYKDINYYDFQGSTWAPHLIHRDLWNKVGGFSEEYFPGTGSDPDLNMKLWNEGVRIFKGLERSKVYHFGSIVTRKSKNKNTITETGSKGSKIFLLKWGIKIKFFNKYYLNGCVSKNGQIHCNKYLAPLNNPKKDFYYIFDLFLNKLSYFYCKFTFKYEYRKNN